MGFFLNSSNGRIFASMGNGYFWAINFVYLKVVLSLFQVFFISIESRDVIGSDSNGP